MERILIVEDEPRLASFLEKGLGANGFTTTVAAVPGETKKDNNTSSYPSLFVRG